MTPFLKQVADHYYNEGKIEDKCFVFPNRRSMIWFRKHLCTAVRDLPLLAPQMLTINDFFGKASGVPASDRVRLLLELYDSYKELNLKAESLDEFIFWGDVILADFNDVDKYMVDPKQLFANVADFKALQDTFEYLTDTQREAIKGFLSHFNDQSGKLTVDLGTDDPDVKGRFLQIWNILYPLYVSYNKSLADKGMAYEGMVYRGLAERLKDMPVDDVFQGIFHEGTTFVFVGLNALNECEKTLLRKLRDAGKAEFCWDWSGDMIRDPQNRSSFFMADNVLEFPQAAQWDPEGVRCPEINVISVASSAGQAKRLPDILRQRSGATEECAVVLPDEGLLKSVLNSIPEEIHDINVTMGLPMSGSLFYTMMADISAIQMHVVKRKDTWLFYHKQVWDLFSSEIFRKAADEKTMEIVAKVKEKARYYIPNEELNGTPLMDAIFRPVIMDPKMASAAQIASFAQYQKDVIEVIAPSIIDDDTLALELEYAKEYYKCINVLIEISPQVLPMTYLRLLGQLLASVSVPFKGEPLKGLQIMGPLETRALDFRDLIIMSANEGVFPRRNVSSSFIPPELRKGFGMPTYEFQDAVWAYYFYRMISRAEKVWMLVDSRTEGLKSGEESRYIKQLEYHFGVPLKRSVVKFGSMKTAVLPDISKTEEDVVRIKETVLSATTLQNYLACPAKFYYGTVKGLEVEEEVAESLDYGMFGTVYHDTMRALYTSEEAMDPEFSFNDREAKGGLKGEALKTVSQSYIEGWLHRKEDIKTKVKALIMMQLNTIEVSGRNLVVADVIVRYIIKTLQCDLDLLKKEGRDSFEILGREIRVAGEFCGQRFKGFIDRLDSFKEGEARVVDYKTGKVLEDDENIHDGNAEEIAEKIFHPDMKNWPKIALQFYIYDMLVQSRPEIKGRKICNCVYSTANLFKEPPVTVPMNAKFYDAVSERLEAMLDQMYDTSVPFHRTDDEKTCTYCDFRMICGR
ncbi:MAG: PD-(D/E)XK nuclease family protein [Bacteroidales bacterium]|nr:PD-(D/E)XK nuclease family protein [Bacteroidales bacterium]